MFREAVGGRFKGHSLHQTSMAAPRGPSIEDDNLLRGPSPLSCCFGGVCSDIEGSRASGGNRFGVHDL